MEMKSTNKNDTVLFGVWGLEINRESNTKEHDNEMKTGVALAASGSVVQPHNDS